MGQRSHSARWHSCNVFHALARGRRVWQFDTSSGKVTLAAELEFPPGQPVPAKIVQRGWRNLWRPRLNVAWLPADHVFLRVVHLPKGAPEELQPMLELQLEKLSPAPVNQIFWTYQPVPHPAAELQTVIVIIAQRSSVESYLGTLEQDGYLPDRLEIPWLHHVIASRPDSDQTCVYLLSRESSVICLAAWWYGQTLQNLDLFHVARGQASPESIAEQLARVAWAGEVEGWLAEPPRWRFTGEPSDLETWIPSLRERLSPDLETESTPNVNDLAHLSARRGLRGEATANLLPAEFSTRYRQQFIDRLWMSGLGAAILVYMVLVLIYLGAVQVFEHKHSRLQDEIAQLSGSYTNALLLKERVQVYTEQAELKYAALNCLRVVSELLPSEITLTAFTFQGGRSVRLAGTVAEEYRARVTDYHAELRNATIDGTALFDKKNYGDLSFASQAGAGARWSFTADLNRIFTE